MIMILVDIVPPDAYIFASIKNKRIGIFAMKVEIFALVAVLALAGCGKEKPSSQVVPKTTNSDSEQSMGLPAGHPEIAPDGASGMPSGTMMGSDADNAAVAAAHADMMESLPQSAFEAELPAGWEEIPSSSSMRLVSYSIEDTSIDFYLIALSMGDVASNVNRWRGQVGLPAASAEEIAADVGAFDVEGHSTRYIEIYNEEEGMGIIAAIIDLTPSYWYFTAKGSVDELKAHAGDIRSFIESITIN